jgi:hypothetical protein
MPCIKTAGRILDEMEIFNEAVADQRARSDNHPYFLEGVGFKLAAARELAGAPFFSLWARARAFRHIRVSSKLRNMALTPMMIEASLRRKQSHRALPRATSTLVVAVV